jgi:CDGSH-type Zn-finger protein
MTVFNDGPIKVEGNFVLKDARGKAFDLAGRGAVALCRCGGSANKPFCDGTHKTIGFSSTVDAGQG